MGSAVFVLDFAARPGRAAVQGDDPIVARVHQRRRQQEVRRGAVAGDGSVVDDGNAQQRLDVDVVGLGLERVPEEDDEVDALFDNACADLLIAPERTVRNRITSRLSSAASRAPVVPVAYSSCPANVP